MAEDRIRGHHGAVRDIQQPPSRHFVPTSLSMLPGAARTDLGELGLLAELVADARTPIHLYRALAEFARRLTPADSILVSLYDPIRQERTCVYSAGPDGEEDNVSGLPKMPLNDSPQSRAIRAGDVVVIADWDVELKDHPVVLLGMDRDPQLPRSSIAVPMKVQGRIIGVFELQSYRAEAFGEQHVPAFRLAADLAALATEIVRAPVSARHRAVVRADRQRLESVIRDRQFTSVFQPVVDFQTGSTVGYEALTRFADGADPQERFQMAAASGLGGSLEEATLRSAIEASRNLAGDAWLSLNVSPSMVLTHEPLNGLVASVGRPVVVEITEHAAVGDYALFLSSLERLATRVQLAIDDAGAGYASFRHILELRPGYVKLDRGLIHGVDTDPARLALIRGLADFATASGATLVAEGVETQGECETLRGLGVPLGQGYYFGRPRAVLHLAADGLP